MTGEYRDEVPGWELLRDAHEDHGSARSARAGDPVAAAADAAAAEVLAADARAWLDHEDRALLAAGVDLRALERDLDRALETA